MPTTVLAHARLIDATGGDPVDDAWVALDGDRISDVGTGGPPAGGSVVDCAGRTLMPGLIDLHAHLSVVEYLNALDAMPRAVFAARVFAEMKDTLGRGFTTIRDAGMLDAGFRIAVDRGVVPGPRLFVSNAPISQTGGHCDEREGWYGGDPLPPTDGLYWRGIIADGVPEVRRATREVFRRGADQVKIMASGGCASPTDDVTHVQFSDDEMAAIVWEASARGSYALAHAYNPASILSCVRAGVRTVEHGNLIDEESAAAMVAAGTYLVPTITTYELLAADGPHMGMPANQVEKIKVVLERAYDGLQLAVDAGVRIGSGSDLLGRHQPHKAMELELKSRVIGPMAAIVSATATNAEIIGLGEDLGTVRPGRIADLLLVDGDPLDNITLLQRPEALHLVVQSGRVVADRRPQ